MRRSAITASAKLGAHDLTRGFHKCFTGRVELLMRTSLAPDRALCWLSTLVSSGEVTLLIERPCTCGESAAHDVIGAEPNSDAVVGIAHILHGTAPISKRPPRAVGRAIAMIVM